MQCQLQPLEAICVAGAVEDCLDRLRVLQSLTPNVITQRDELSNILGDTVAQIIEQQKKCEANYERLVKQRSELKSLSNKTRYKQNQEAIEKQARELQELTCDLCKRLRESPNVSENLMKIQNLRTELITLFESFRAELLDKRTFVGIAQATNKKKEHYENMMQVIQQDKEMQRQIEELSQQIQKTEQEMQRKIESLDTQIKEQKEILVQKQSENEAEKAKRDDERNARMEAIMKMNQIAQGKLTKQLKSAKYEANNEQRVHSETKSYFQRRRAKINEETKYWTEKYDTESNDKTREFQNLTDRIEKATTEHIILKPKKEEGEKLLKLELVRSEERARQIEIYSQQVSFMNKLKVLYVLRNRLRGPLPKPKGGKKKKKK
ncbi:hypothetical protein M9Y10_044118 [Tritrichomonas musculus]|uniref:Dynein regulatory complex protein 9 n=1 Tax=Tritrichomonas musculus TaxID=1915356 RepID=A0ABR2K4I3_9EUKA